MRSRWFGTPASDDKGPAQGGDGGGTAQSDLEGAGIKEGLGDQNHGPHVVPSFPIESTISSNRPLRKKRVPSPTLGPAGVHYHKPPPALPALSGHLWNPDVEAK